VLHDVGELLLAAQRPAWLAEAAALANVRHIPLDDAETELFGVSHAEIGAYLVGLWGLPFRIVEAVAQHHAPTRGGCPGSVNVVAAVHIADALVSQGAAGRGAVPAGVPAALDQAFLGALGVAERLDGWRAAAGGP
jgi:HD-like signal output (HDOD) protein